MATGPLAKDKPAYHELDDGYALASGPERDFGAHYAIYRNVNPEFDEFLDYGADLEGLNHCFWILRRGERIGGIIIRPNHIEGLFLRPPHDNAYDVLRRVLPVLLGCSNKAEPIEAIDVMPSELELYQRLGFTHRGGRRVYVRPTERLQSCWEDGYQITTPTSAHVADAARLFHVSYRDYPAEWGLGAYSLPDWVARTESRLASKDVPEVCHRASTLVYDSARQVLAGACIVRLSQSIVRPDVRYAKVLDIAVHPQYRRHGLASNMLRQALTALYGEFPVLKFGVAIGNPAEALYYSLGFLPGVAHAKLVLQTGVDQSQ